MGMYTGIAISENSMVVLQKNKNRTAIWPSVSTSGYISKGNWIWILKRYLYPHVCCSIIHSSQDAEMTLMPVDGWVMQTWCVQAKGHYPAFRKEETLWFATIWMDLEHTLLREISWTQKDKCCISFICRILVNQTTEAKKKMVVAMGGG